MRRLVVFFFIALCVISSLAAERFVIRNYEFSSSGKTLQYPLFNLVVPEEEEAFVSEEAVVEALERKTQTLRNKRVFKDVSYTYTLEKVPLLTFVDVHFDVVDANTFLAIPYPKYDTNYGTILGLKVYDTNPFGTLANVEGFFQGIFADGNWDNPTVNTMLKVSNLEFANGSVFSFYGSARGSRENLEDYDLGVTYRKIPLFGKLTLDTA
ncbi:MAG: hypothetical protein KBS81_02590, partial [Spirochaetales bacterium]|nr:hypothetical protein [Candidatus Physcosoma equi]